MSMVKATIKRITSNSFAVARCGRCGQALWVIERDEDTGKATLEARTNGHRYDANRGIWHPSELYRKKLIAANDRVSRGQDRPGDREAVRLAHGFDGRPPRMHEKSPTTFQVPETAFELPARIECPQCGTVNEVDEDLHNV